MARRIAVVLFNLGGPDGPDSVRPFLRNLFRDPAIIGAPGLIREALAWLISTTRTKEATENYAKMGGGSPSCLKPKQATALTAALRELAKAMRCAASSPCATGIPLLRNRLRR
jgi:ferrochelatase